jgi:hypothetical protein
MRNFKIVCSVAAFLALSLLVSSCAAITSIQTGKPLDPAQVQADAAAFKAGVNDADCLVADVAPVAAAIGGAVGGDSGGAAADAATKAGNISKPLCKQPQ